MPQIEINIERINNKLQQLLKQHYQLQKDNERQSKLIKELQEHKQKNTQTIEILQQQVNILKASAGSMSEVEKKSFEKQINHYIKEIDKCISVISQ